MLFSLLSYQYFAFFQNLLTFMQAKLRHYLLCFDVTSVNLSSLTSHERPTKEKAVVKKICLSNNNEILHPCPLIWIELGGLHGWIIQVNSVKPPIKSVRWPLKAFAEITCFVKQNILQCIIKGIFCDVSEFRAGHGDIFGTIYVPSWLFLYTLRSHFIGIYEMSSLYKIAVEVPFSTIMLSFLTLYRTHDIPIDTEGHNLNLIMYPKNVQIST